MRFHIVITVLVLVVMVGANGQSTQFTEAGATNAQPDQTVAEVEADLSTNTTSSTGCLIATLEGLKSRDLRYEDNFVQVTEGERMKGPPMYGEFVKITNELANRGGESIWLGFEQVLTADELIADDKMVVRNCFRAKTGKDVPFTLPADDRAQTHQYWLLFDPKKCKSFTVRKGDVLAQIGREAYPKLSQWSAVDILVFINDLKSRDSVRAGRTISIYDYKIVKNEPAP